MNIVEHGMIQKKMRKKCEQRHLKPKKIEYIAYNDSVAQYPRYIGLRFEDGSYVVYTRK